MKDKSPTHGKRSSSIPSNISNNKRRKHSTHPKKSLTSSSIMFTGNHTNDTNAPPNNNPPNINTTNLFLNSWLHCGKFALSLNSNYSIAINCFESALRISPTNNDAINLLVDSLTKRDLIYANFNGINSTIDLINSAINYYPELGNDIDLISKLSNNYLLVNEFEKSHSIILNALENNKNSPLLWLSFGKSLHKLNLLGESVDALRNSLNMLPKTLNHENDINIARNIHLELVQILIGDKNLEPARNELNAALSLPPPTDPVETELFASLIKHLIILYQKNGNLLDSLQLCEVTENVLPDEPNILLLHSFFLLMNDKPFFNPNKARRLLHNIIQKDKYYIDSPSIVEFINSKNGDFLPWLQLAECYMYLRYDTIAFDCLEVAIRKIHYPTILPEFKNLTLEILNITNNDLLKTDLNLFINALDDTPKLTLNQNFSIIDLLIMSYEERSQFLNNDTENEIRSKRPLQNQDLLQPPQSQYQIQQKDQLQSQSQYPQSSFQLTVKPNINNLIHLNESESLPKHPIVKQNESPKTKGRSNKTSPKTRINNELVTNVMDLPSNEKNITKPLGIRTVNQIPIQNPSLPYQDTMYPSVELQLHNSEYATQEHGYEQSPPGQQRNPIEMTRLQNRQNVHQLQGPQPQPLPPQPAGRLIHPTPPPQQQPQLYPPVSNLKYQQQPNPNQEYAYQIQQVQQPQIQRQMPHMQHIQQFPQFQQIPSPQMAATQRYTPQDQQHHHLQEVYKQQQQQQQIDMSPHQPYQQLQQQEQYNQPPLPQLQRVQQIPMVQMQQLRPPLQPGQMPPPPLPGYYQQQQPRLQRIPRQQPGPPLPLPQQDHGSPPLQNQQPQLNQMPSGMAYPGTMTIPGPQQGAPGIYGAYY